MSIKQERKRLKLKIASLLFFRGEKDGKVICEMLGLPFLTLYEHSKTEAWRNDLAFWGMAGKCQNVELTGHEFLSAAIAKKAEKDTKPSLEKVHTDLTAQVASLSEQVENLTEHLEKCKC